LAEAAKLLDEMVSIATIAMVMGSIFLDSSPHTG